MIITGLTSKSYQDILNEKIFSPLGMTNSFVDFNEKKENVTTPGYTRALKKVEPWTFSSFKGSEGIKSSAEDFCDSEFCAYSSPFQGSLACKEQREAQTNIHEQMWE